MNDCMCFIECVRRITRERYWKQGKKTAKRTLTQRKEENMKRNQPTNRLLFPMVFHVVIGRCAYIELSYPKGLWATTSPFYRCTFIKMVIVFSWSFLPIILYIDIFIGQPFFRLPLSNDSAPSTFTTIHFDYLAACQYHQDRVKQYR